MKLGLNVTGKFAGKKEKVFGQGEDANHTYKYAVSFPRIDGYAGEVDVLEVTIPKAEHHSPMHKSFQALKEGQLVQVFFRKNSGEVEGRAYVNYNPTVEPVLLKEAN